MQLSIQTLENFSQPQQTTCLLYRGASRAKILAQLERVKALQAKGQAFGVRCIELFATLDPNTQLLKTHQLYYTEDLKQSCKTYPKSGIMQNGKLYRTSHLDSLTDGRDCMLLPTPVVSDKNVSFATMAALIRYLQSCHQTRLVDILKLKGFSKSQIVQQLEEMMGFPITHTELKR